MKQLLSLTMAIALCALATGCGQKGPLFIPQDAEPAESQQPADTE